jgi:tetratricopeptide (TPR) repeat protein
MIALLPVLVPFWGCASAPAVQKFSQAAPPAVRLSQAAPPAATDATHAPAKPKSAEQITSAAEAVQLGDTAWAENQLDRAVYYYVTALERSPNDAPSMAKIGAIEESRGNDALALKAFEMAHAAAPEEPRIAERLAALYLQQAKVDAAALLYSQVLATHPERTRALDGMGVVCILRAQYSQSIQYFDQALMADKSDAAAVLTHRGYAKLLSEDMPGAEADLRAALAMGREPDAWRYLANLQVRRHDTAAAFESLLKVMDAAHAYNEIGVLLMNMTDYRDSEQYFSKAISASPSWYEEAQSNLSLADEHLHTTVRAAPAP